MQHTSVKLNTPCEMINITPVNPLISKCQIKVCYVGDDPNRNKSIITKDVARDLANSLPGSPIVGYYNENKGDFEEHNRVINISNGEFKMTDVTRPYGFVDLGAKVWFQWFEDDGVKHEYLMTEGYIWTGQYPEANRILEQGNNQSMELDQKLINAHWSKDKNGKPEFFIINEAIISKLCILGQDCEPCFEGADITKVQFSLEDEFKEQLFSLMDQMKQILCKGGISEMAIENIDEQEKELDAELKNPDVDNAEGGQEPEGTPEGTEDTPAEGDVEFKKKKEEDEEEDKKDPEDKSEDKSDDSEDKKEESEDKKDDSEEKKDEEDDDEEDEKKKGKKAKYNLEEIEEYVELSKTYCQLQKDFDSMKSEKEALEAQINELKAFKLSQEKAEKQAMIDSFYMLSDADKEDVVTNIDTYSLSDIEAKLSIICVRNKVSFNLDDDDSAAGATTYNLGSANTSGNDTPDWIKAVKAMQETM